MYNVDSNILEKYASDSREIFVRATFNGTHKVNGDYIKTFTVSDSVSGSNDTLSLGNACSAKLELDMFMPPTTGYTYTDAETGETTTYNDFVGLANAEIKLEVGVEVDGEVKFTPIGVFFIDSYESKNEFRSVKITAFDGMLKIDNALGSSYTCSLSVSNPTALDVLKDILTQAGISTAYIGEATSGGSSWQAYPQTAAGIKYSDAGEKTNTNTSIGMNTPFWISANANDIEFILVSDSQTFPSAIKVLYFSDENLTNLLSVNNYEVDTEFITDSGLGWEVEVQTTTPVHSESIYVVFCADIPSYSTSDLKLYIGIDQNIPRVINYVNSAVTIPNPNTVDVSARTMLGYMAGILGCNAKFDRNGHFILKRIGGNTEVDIDRPQQYMDGFQKTTADILTIGYLTTGSDTNGEGQGEVVSVGSGTFGFNFENPYIPLTVNMQPDIVANTILDLYKNTAFLSGSVKYRYDPSIDCGDIVCVEGNEGDYFKVIVLGHKISMTGGLSATVECIINTDTAKEFVSTPSSKKLTSKFNDFITKYQDIVKVLTSVSGGFVKEVRDSSEKVRALAITQSDIEVEWDETNNKVVVVHSYDSSVPMWVWSYGGLSFSNNGGASYEVAINMRGEIYSNNLVSARGTIGSFTIDDASITYKGGLFTDYVPSSGNGTAYRVFIQPAYVDNTNAAADTWVISTQKATVTNGSIGRYTGTFVVHADGDVDTTGNMDIGGILKINRYIQDMRGYEVFATNNNYVFGYGAYANGLPTYLEGKSVNITVNGGIDIRSTLTFNTIKWDGVAMPTIESNSDLFINVPKDKAIFLQAPGGVYVYGNNLQVRTDAIIDGNIKANSTIICPKGLALNDDGYLDLHKSGNVLTVGSGMGSITLNAANDGIIKCTSDFRLNFRAVSGSVPLVVNTSGTVTAATSSERYKENVTKKLNDDLNPDNLYNLPIKQYNYKPEYKDCELVSGTQIGITAEDVDKYYPNACIYNENGEPESWQDRIMIPAMLKLIQEQKQEIESLKQRLEKIEKEQGDYNA